VTDRPDPQSVAPALSDQLSSQFVASAVSDHPDPRSAAPAVIDIRPLPKAQARQAQKSGGRKKLSSSILTNTPIKETLRLEHSARKLKKAALLEKRNIGLSKKATQKKTTQKKSTKAKKASRPTRKTLSDEEESELDSDKLCDDSDDDDAEEDIGVPMSTNRPVRRKLLNKNMTSCDICTVCGEVSRDKELWHRCRACSSWAHEACTSASIASRYMCDNCTDDMPKPPKGRKKLA
jgi:hypothetical protein